MVVQLARVAPQATCPRPLVSAKSRRPPTVPLRDADVQATDSRLLMPGTAMLPSAEVATTPWPSAFSPTSTVLPDR
jgi:hypothetical protein